MSTYEQDIEEIKLYKQLREKYIADLDNQPMDPIPPEVPRNEYFDIQLSDKTITINFNKKKFKHTFKTKELAEELFEFTRRAKYGRGGLEFSGNNIIDRKSVV